MYAGVVTQSPADVTVPDFARKLKSAVVVTGYGIYERGSTEVWYSVTHILGHICLKCLVHLHRKQNKTTDRLKSCLNSCKLHVG